jgi:CDP-glucose 4,6-dehydratase
MAVQTCSKNEALNAYRERRVFLTGHTGFKGAWLAEWLLALGADVYGFSFDELPTHPALFEQLALAPRLKADTRGDIRNRSALADALCAAEPDFVFHLAAQPLVRLSYEIPVETFETNVIGIANLLEAVRECTERTRRAVGVVIVTTDKCYENREWLHAYREEDPFGGYDPYSASKGCAELVTAAFRRSYFGAAQAETLPVAVASARAGNVIGGGDYAAERIVPDCIRALSAGAVISVRNPHATRPWQHVLEPLGGYLRLGVALFENARMNAPARARPERACFESGFNFGPTLDSNRTVGALVEEILKHWDGRWENCWRGDAPHEASLLNLAIDKAHHLLGWRPRWDFETAVKKTIEWYRLVAGGASAADLTRQQIAEYSS